MSLKVFLCAALRKSTEMHPPRVTDTNGISLRQEAIVAVSLDSHFSRQITDSLIYHPGYEQESSFTNLHHFLSLTWTVSQAYHHYLYLPDPVSNLMPLQTPRAKMAILTLSILPRKPVAHSRSLNYGNGNLGVFPKSVCGDLKD